jgi:methionyl-tRNA formyltransferase
MDAGLDTGPVLSRVAIPIGPTDTTGSLHDRLASLGAQALLDALEGVAAGMLRPIPQPTEGITYAAKIDKAEAQVDWRQPALCIERRIRAFDPFPGAATRLGEQSLKLWRARVCAGAGRPDTVLAVDAHTITVACGEAALALQTVQRAGGRRVSAGGFARGHGLAPGARFGADAPA